MIAIAGRSSFVMAHRLGTTRQCDQIERGRVVGMDGRQQPVWVRS
jgi:ABC-type multidrug transport system fused ATPase/permease subunit